VENGWLLSDGTELVLGTVRYGTLDPVGPVGGVLNIYTGLDAVLYFVS